MISANVLFLNISVQKFTVYIFNVGIALKMYCEAFGLKGFTNKLFRVCSIFCVIVQYIIVPGVYHVQKCTVQLHSIFESQIFKKMYCIVPVAHVGFLSICGTFFYT